MVERAGSQIFYPLTEVGEVCYKYSAFPKNCNKSKKGPEGPYRETEREDTLNTTGRTTSTN